MLLNKTISVTLILLCTTISYGQKNEISILNNRFFYTFPDSAKDIARPTNIMAAGPNANKETRVMYDIGDKRIVFFAQELFLKSASDLETRIKNESTPEYSFTTKSIYNKDSVQCIRISPSKFDENAKAILTNSIVIKNADNTLSRFDVYLNPKAFAERATFDKITDQVLATFRKGNRRMNLNARIDSFVVLGSKNVMQINLPKDYIVSFDDAVDFETYNIRKVVAYGDTLDASVMIYFGFHPSSFSYELGLTDFKIADTDGEFMLQKMKWVNFKDDSRRLIVREHIFQDDNIQEGAKIHIAMISNDQKAIEELTALVKNILLKYHK